MWAASPAMAQDAPFSAPAFGAAPCWESAQPATVEESGHVLANAEQRQVRRVSLARGGKAAVLALSAGEMRIAYAAGLLVGWGETGLRPDFSVVTAAGKSALLAPFAFVGDLGDKPITMLMNCADASGWSQFADEAVALLDADILGAIARRHRAGARLLVALPGSPARQETVWDIGALAAAGDNASHALIARILKASIDLEALVPPEASGHGAGRLVERNRVFREVGTGEAFLWPDGMAVGSGMVHLIHNGVLFPDESDEFLTRFKPADEDKPGVWLVPGLVLFKKGQAAHAQVRFASVRPNLNLAAQRTFDPAYLKGLYLWAFRQGRMGKEWRTRLPSLSAP
ncbi:MAG: hypothetical protein EKK41_21395 [Hyphomicrobiales bacterium]|nr:MAG: hypothetical protein EKK41_21395 [Hyphomicrobiales bacterium]